MVKTSRPDRPNHSGIAGNSTQDDDAEHRCACGPEHRWCSNRCAPDIAWRIELDDGFALRDTLLNIISGFLVFVDRPFTIDDLVEIDGQYGRVDKITLRTTRIITVDGRMLAVPNSIVMNKTVASYTNYPHLRIDIAVTVAVTENYDVREILLALIRSNPAYISNPLPRVVVVKLNDYNVALELQAWLKDERDHIQQRFDLREAYSKHLRQPMWKCHLKLYGLRHVIFIINR